MISDYRSIEENNLIFLIGHLMTIKVLKTIDINRNGDKRILYPDLRKKLGGVLGLNKNEQKVVLKALTCEGYIGHTPYKSPSGCYYHLTDKGRNFLEDGFNGK